MDAVRAPAIIGRWGWWMPEWDEFRRSVPQRQRCRAWAVAFARYT